MEDCSIYSCANKTGITNNDKNTNRHYRVFVRSDFFVHKESYIITITNNFIRFRKLLITDSKKAKAFKCAKTNKNRLYFTFYKELPIGVFDIVTEDDDNERFIYFD